MEKKGYQFIGWYVDKECTKRINPGGILFNVTTLYQKWLPLNYPILYKVNGGMNSRLNPRTINIESKDVSLFPAKKKDFVFKGWYLDGQPVTKLPEGHYGPLTLEARFAKPFLVEFETNGGADMEPLEVPENGKLLPFRDPMRMGYTFEGWYWDKDYLFPFDKEQFVTNSCTLYAKWIQNIYTIEYDADGGILARSNPKTFTFEDGPIVLKGATKKGYVFEGWYNQFDKKVEFIRKNTMGDMKLKARFTKKESL